MSNTIVVRLDELPEAKLDRRSTLLREAGKMAVGEALVDAHFANGGIVGFTKYGERYPELWLSCGRRVHPIQFGAGILNSVIGYCSIVYHLTGPQILLTSGSITEVAQLQLGMERADLMVLLMYSDPDFVVAEVMV